MTSINAKQEALLNALLKDYTDPVQSKNPNASFLQCLWACHHPLNVLISPLRCPILTRRRDLQG
jgi:predicted metal-binding protein